MRANRELILQEKKGGKQKLAEDNRQEKDRQIYYDCLRIAATLAVMIIHVSAQNWYSVEITTREWQALNFYDSITRWAVPVFVMVSGALFLGGTQGIERIYKKNIARIVTAFLFWSFVYACVGMFTSYSGIKKVLAEIVQGPYHMWFLLMIIGLYMIVPLVRKFTESVEMTRYFLLLSLVFTFLIPQFVVILSLKSGPLGEAAGSFFEKAYFHFTLGYVSYFVCGYYLSKVDMGRKIRRAVYFMGICGFIMTVAFSVILSFMRQEADSTFYQYFSVNVMLESIAVFVFGKNVFGKVKFSARTEEIIIKLSKYSFGAYCVHAMVLDKLDSLLGVNALSFQTIVSVPAIGILVFVISFAISGILNHIPVLKNVV